MSRFPEIDTWVMHGTNIAAQRGGELIPWDSDGDVATYMKHGQQMCEIWNSTNIERYTRELPECKDQPLYAMLIVPGVNPMPKPGEWSYGSEDLTEDICHTVLGQTFCSKLMLISEEEKLHYGHCFVDKIGSGYPMRGEKHGTPVNFYRLGIYPMHHEMRANGDNSCSYTCYPTGHILPTKPCQLKLQHPDHGRAANVRCANRAKDVLVMQAGLYSEDGSGLDWIKPPKNYWNGTRWTWQAGLWEAYDRRLPGSRFYQFDDDLRALGLRRLLTTGLVPPDGCECTGQDFGGHCWDHNSEGYAHGWCYVKSKIGCSQAADGEKQPWVECTQSKETTFAPSSDVVDATREHIKALQDAPREAGTQLEGPLTPQEGCDCVADGSFGSTCGHHDDYPQPWCYVRESTPMCPARASAGGLWIKCAPDVDQSALKYETPAHCRCRKGHRGFCNMHDNSGYPWCYVHDDKACTVLHHGGGGTWVQCLSKTCHNYRVEGSGLGTIDGTYRRGEKVAWKVQSWEYWTDKQQLNWIWQKDGDDSTAIWYYQGTLGRLWVIETANGSVYTSAGAFIDKLDPPSSATWWFANGEYRKEFQLTLRCLDDLSPEEIAALPPPGAPAVTLSPVAGEQDPAAGEQDPFTAKTAGTTPAEQEYIVLETSMQEGEVVEKLYRRKRGRSAASYLFFLGEMCVFAYLLKRLLAFMGCLDKPASSRR